MPLPWITAKPVPAPTDLELDLVEKLEALTECAEDNATCPEVVAESRNLLDRAKDTLGIVSEAAGAKRN
jgi:hypothetical protein